MKTKGIHRSMCTDSVGCIHRVLAPADCTLRLEFQRITAQQKLSGLSGSVVDPDPKLFAGSGSGKNHSASEQLRIRNEFEIKVLWNTGKFLTISQQKCSI
jgi:hypothetical protein